MEGTSLCNNKSCANFLTRRMPFGFEFSSRILNKNPSTTKVLSKKSSSWESEGKSSMWAKSMWLGDSLPPKTKTERSRSARMERRENWTKQRLSAESASNRSRIGIASRGRSANARRKTQSTSTAWRNGSTKPRWNWTSKTRWNWSKRTTWSVTSATSSIHTLWRWATKDRKFWSRNSSLLPTSSN